MDGVHAVARAATTPVPHGHVDVPVVTVPDANMPAAQEIPGDMNKRLRTKTDPALTQYPALAASDGAMQDGLNVPVAPSGAQ